MLENNASLAVCRAEAIWRAMPSFRIEQSRKKLENNVSCLREAIKNDLPDTGKENREINQKRSAYYDKNNCQRHFFSGAEV